VVLAPIATAGTGRIGENCDWTTRSRHFLKFGIGEKSEKPSICRPKREHRIIRAFQFCRDPTAQRLDVQRRWVSSGTGRKRDARPITRDRRRPRIVPDHVERGIRRGGQVSMETSQERLRTKRKPDCNGCKDRGCRDPRNAGPILAPWTCRYGLSAGL